MINLRLVLLFIVFVSCSSSKELLIVKENKSRKKVAQKATKKKPTLADKVIWTAVTYKGTPYKYGGTTKQGIDCSALVQNSFAARGISLPRSSYDMSKKGYVISLKEARRGDLIFFKTNPRKPNKISHVGLVTHIKNGVAYFIHASTKRGVTVNNMSERYYKRNFALAKRVL